MRFFSAVIEKAEDYIGGQIELARKGHKTSYGTILSMTLRGRPWNEFEVRFIPKSENGAAEAVAIAKIGEACPMWWPDGMTTGVNGEVSFQARLSGDRLAQQSDLYDIVLLPANFDKGALNDCGAGLEERGR